VKPYAAGSVAVVMMGLGANPATNGAATTLLLVLTAGAAKIGQNQQFALIYF